MVNITYPYKKWLYPEDEEENPIEFRNEDVLNKLICRMEENKIIIKDLFDKYPDIRQDFVRFQDQNPKYNAIAKANNSLVEPYLLSERVEKFGRFQNALNNIKELADKRDSYVDHNYIIRLHDSLYYGDPEFINKAKYRYRNDQDNEIQTPYFKPTEGKHVSLEMMKLVNNTDFKWNTMHVVKQSTLLHLGISRVQPFMDGNKKTAQLLQNFYLLKAGFPDIVLPDKCMKNYMNAVKLGILHRDATPLAELVSNCILHEQLDTFEFIKYDLNKSVLDEIEDIKNIETNEQLTKLSLSIVPQYEMEKDTDGNIKEVECFQPTAEENAVPIIDVVQSKPTDETTMG